MAPKNQVLSHQPSKEELKREESSDEEEVSETESSGTEEEGSSEEEEGNQASTKPFKPQTLAPKSESKSKLTSQVNDSDSETESEGSPPPPEYVVHLNRKPSPSPAKRTHEESREDPSRSSKKSKTGAKEEKKTSGAKEEKKTSGAKEEKKTSASAPGGIIARLWSDEDEIAVLNGMIDFRKVKGNDNNSEEIYNFIKGKLQGEFNKEQLRTKITRMKKRFLNALKKSGEGGSDPVFSKPHEDMAFELSKKIWGDAANGSVAVKNGNAKKDVVKNGNGNAIAKKDVVKNWNVKTDTLKAAVEDKDEEGNFWSKYPYLSSSFLNLKGNLPSSSISEATVNLLKEKITLIEESKAKELNQKWRELFQEEAELNNKMLTLMAEQTKLGLNQMNDG
ncbi:hypothetical protein ACS0TY_017824 [Phlomoides rotata]